MASAAKAATSGIPTALTSRGLTYLSKDAFDRSLADFSEHIRIDPNNGAHCLRAQANFGPRTNFAAAAGDSAKQSNPLNPYRVSPQHEVEVLGADDKLRATSAKLKQLDWPYPAVKLFLQEPPGLRWRRLRMPMNAARRNSTSGEWQLVAPIAGRSDGSCKVMSKDPNVQYREGRAKLRRLAQG
jgi:hypothetical protein